MLKLTVVGCGTAAPEPGRVCSGYWIESGGERLLVDCGPGVVHGMARLGLPWPRLDHLLVSHFHNDHIGDIPMLLFALKWGTEQRRTAPLTLWAPEGIRSRLTAMAAAFGDHVAEPGFPLVVREVAPGDDVGIGPLRVKAAATPHTAESLCYTVADTTGMIGYTGDTGPSRDVARFMAGCDVLIAECSLPDDSAIPTHLSPSSLAEMAAAAAPGRLVVTHVYPWLDAMGPLALLRQAGYDGATVRARDGLELTTGAP